MEDRECVRFLQWALPRMRMRWAGFRKVRRQVCRRVGRRMAALGIEGLEAYEQVLERDPEEWAVLDGLCRITISRFYRDRRIWEILEARVLPAVVRLAAERGEGGALCWSAGCASGEEAYSLALIAVDAEVEIVGTDADGALLERARAGIYGASSLKELPERLRETAFEEEDRGYRLKDEHRRRIRFQRGDIRREAPDGRFHLALCRNLAFTYFEEPLQKEVLERLAGRIVPGGFLVIGAHETIPGRSAPFEPLEGAPGIFRPAPDSG